MKGEVSITKVYANGDREVVLDKGKNVLTDGFGIGITSLFTATPTRPIDQYKFKYFQVGTDCYYSDVVIPEVSINTSEWAYSLPYTTHNNFYELSGALTDPDEYGTDGDIETVEKEILTVTNPFQTYDKLNYTTKKVLLAKLVDDPVTKLTERSVHVKITIDRESLNGVSLREFGLFTENPENKFRPVAALAAYKSLPEPIIKTEEFSLDIEWIIKTDPYTQEDPYYDEWDLQRVGDTLRFYSGVTNRGGQFYTATIPDDQVFVTPGDGPGTGTSRQAKGRYLLKVESYVPTTRDGYLHYSLSGTAVSGIHYEVDYRQHSPIFVPKGTTTITIPIYSLSSDDGYSSSFTNLEVHLDEFTGGKQVPQTLRDGTPEYFRLFFKNSKQPPVIELSTSSGGGEQAVKATLNTSCMDPVDVYLMFTSTGALSVKDSRGDIVLQSNDPVEQGLKLTIPYSELDNYFIVSGDAATEVAVSCYNIVNGEPETNYFAHSNSFVPEEQIPVVLSIKDIVSHTQDLITRNSPWWRKNIGHGRIYHPGYPTIKTHSGWDSYSTGPTQHMYLNSTVLSGTKAPDGLQDATLSYAPSSIYIWPEVLQQNKEYYENTGQARPVDSPPKIRRSYSSDEKDSLGRTIGRESQLLEFDYNTSVISVSMYVKQVDGGSVFVSHPNFVETEQVASSEYFQLRIFSRGFKETGGNLTPGSDGKGCYATFQWNSDGELQLVDTGSNAGSAWLIEGATVTGGVFSGTTGDFQKYGYIDKWASVEDGWYRAFISCEVPTGLTDQAPNAGLNYDGLGAVSQYFIIPTMSATIGTAKTNLPGYSNTLDRAPEVLSGTVHCWAQWDQWLKSEARPDFNGYKPKPYQPRSSDFWEPIGNAYVSEVEAKQKVDISF